MSVYLSASSIKDFIRCSQKVKYRFTKEVEETKSIEMTIGNIVHSAIEKHWNDKSAGISLIDEQARLYGLNKREYSSARAYLETYHIAFKELLTDNDLIEKMFKLHLYDDVFIVGKMDRISRGIVYDWKTGTIRSRKLFNDPQCIIYDFAYTKLFKKKPNGVFLAGLQTGELIQYVENSLYVDELFNNIIPRMVKTVRNSSYERLGLFNGACFKCPYRIGCLATGVEEDVMDSSISPE